MTRDELYNLVNKIVSDTIDSDAFDALLDTAQEYFEGQRPWMVLRKSESSQLVLPASNIFTAYNLPTDFNRWYEEYPVQLVLANAPQSVYPLREVPIARKFIEQFNPWKFFCDYSTNKIYLCGAQITGLTIHQFYISEPVRISANSVVNGSVVYPNSWVFPERYHKILAWIIAAFYKNGVDYDPLNAQQAVGDTNIMNIMYSSMKKWDDELQNASITGLDNPQPTSPSTPGFGNVGGQGFVNLNG